MTYDEPLLTSHDNCVFISEICIGPMYIVRSLKIAQWVRVY